MCNAVASEDHQPCYSRQGEGMSVVKEMGMYHLLLRRAIDVYVFRK